MKNFLVNLMQILCLIIQETYILVSQNITVYSSDLHDVIIIPTKRQKTLVIDSDTESGGKKKPHTILEKALQVCQAIECNNP